MPAVARPEIARLEIALPATIALVLVVGVVLAAPLLLASSLPEVTTAGEDTPHLILLVVDTLRYDVFQSVLESTPEGEKLMHQLDGAAHFRQMMAAAPWTAPSVGSIMTGLYPAEHGFGVTEGARGGSRPLRRLAPTVPTLASRLRNRGYLTEALIGNPILHRESGIERGFDRYEVLDGPTNALPLLTAISRLDLIRVEHYPQAPRVVERLRQRLPVLASADRPLFLWLHFMDPHEPIFEHPDLPADAAASDLDTAGRLYRDEVRFTAQHLAHALELLDGAGLTRNAVIALVADHGEMFLSDGHSNGVRNAEGKLRREGHGHALYEELVHVPLIIRPAGGLANNRQVDALASHTDLHDTLVELLGVDVPTIGRDRISLAPWLAPAPDAPRERRWTLLGFAQHGPRQRAMRTPRIKLITYDRDLDPEFYNLRRDPSEQNNLAPKVPEKVERSTLRLNRRWATLEERATEAFEVDGETRRQLEALGYL